MAPVKRQQLSRTATKQMVRSMIASVQERKNANVAIAGGNWTTVGNTTEVTRSIVQGDDILQRSGDMIIVKSMRFRFDTTSTGAGNSVAFRVIIYSDDMSNGAVPATTDVLAIADWRSGYNTFNSQRRRFKIYYDKSFVNVNGTHTSSREIRVDFPKLNHKVFYNGTSNTAADNGRGAVYVLVLSNSVGNGGYSYMPHIIYTDS